MIDYMVIRESLEAIQASMDEAIQQIQASGSCRTYKENLNAKRNGFISSYETLSRNLDLFAQNSERYLKIITDMNYGFNKKDMSPEEPRQCIFPSNEVKEFIGLINEIDVRVFELFRGIGDVKSDIIRVAMICMSGEGRIRLRTKLDDVDAALGRLIDSRELFYHPLDEIEGALPFNLAPEDKQFIALLMKCTTDFPEKLESSLKYMLEAGKPYPF